MEISQISFGDRVRIRSAEATETLGIAGQMGIVNGRTTPSVTNVEVIGKSSKDVAIAVALEAQIKQLWFAEEILEFVDHGAGTIVETQGRKLIRDEHGSWREVTPTDNFEISPYHSTTLSARDSVRNQILPSPLLVRRVTERHDNF